MFQHNLKKIIFILAVTLTVQKASAIFLITPNVGYKTHTIKMTDLLDASSEVKMTSPAFGLKLGLQTMGGIGIDVGVTQSSGKAKFTNAGVESDRNFNHTVGSAQLSVSALNTFKIYLGYILMNELSFKGDTPADSAKLKGGGYQAGLAFNITQSIALGAQYDVNQFNEINIESVGQYEDIKNYFKKTDSQSTTFILSMSF